LKLNISFLPLEAHEFIRGRMSPNGKNAERKQGEKKWKRKTKNWNR
jgi:uncharacterized protein YcaQ